MSIGIGENLTASFGFTKEKLGGNIGTWLILSILNIIPIVNWIVYGAYVKVLRGGDPDLNNMGKSFVDGLLALIIGLIYMIIPIILIVLVSVGMFTVSSVATITPMSSMSPMSQVMPVVTTGAGFALMFGLIILCIIVAFLFALFAKPAVVNFARNGFGAAFRFGEIFRMISKAGWLKYILSLILFWFIFGAIILVCLMIPIIGWILLIFIMPFLYCWGSKYLANLFE
ncbi:hypothetical protein Mlab_0945 [Methanocorpusculum labreanum Z]|uniref:DUF4013 domain-containing protein n=1 Tax=Methanocorpusculum labreanum (strain ATCC 43576 / DSM 4855 / Z) TaxID=410358 RepID=A2SS09_METLZ|nr:DUF4013 domain-containing protein [Methanocorpusculum labreanum]ABN07115.1 hypothetical protein Mlab_0945 [Methanocorpusculum labreanum Z]